MKKVICSYYIRSSNAYIEPYLYGGHHRDTMSNEFHIYLSNVSKVIKLEKLRYMSNIKII